MAVRGQHDHLSSPTWSVFKQKTKQNQKRAEKVKKKENSPPSTLHLRCHCQNGGSCCPLPGCSGRGDCHLLTSLRRSRAAGWTGSQCPPAVTPSSPGGRRRRRGAPTPPGPRTWRTHLRRQETRQGYLVSLFLWSGTYLGAQAINITHLSKFFIRVYKFSRS